MVATDVLRQYRQRAEQELRGNILPFWMEHAVDEERGGFHGEVSNDLQVNPTAPRGALLTARILWTYAAAYRRYAAPAYLAMAQRAYRTLLRDFWDDAYGGLYWEIDHQGQPTQPRKQVYGQAFGIYALAEYHAATGEAEALAKAIDLFRLLEAHSYDPENLGYLEAFTQDWQLADDLRLSAVDMNEKKSMNTHLHMMEAYTNLLRVWDNDDLRHKHQELLRVMLRWVIDQEAARTILFFDELWTPRSEHVSYGHDIETSWLIVEAAEVLGEAALLEETRALAVRMAQAVYEQGRDADGALLYEAGPAGFIETNKEWWPQAEAAVGFLNAYQLSGQEHFLEAALQSWGFIEEHLVDREHGGWFRCVTRDHEVCHDEPKVSFWKCPYHNARACMEVSDRLAALTLSAKPV